MTVVVDQAWEQRHRALQRANAVRTARRMLKEQAKAGEVDVGQLILDPPATLDTAKIGDVVLYAPGIGDWRQMRILVGLARPTARLEMLGIKTRERIVGRLRAFDEGEEE